jgi:hypothetical protein
MFDPDLSFHSKPSTRSFFCVTGVVLVLAVLSAFLRLGGLLPHGAPLAPGAPRWYRIAGYVEYSSVLAALGLWANLSYNSVLQATPSAEDGDPVHFRDPILWSTLLRTTASLVVAAGFLFLTQQ